MPRKHRKKKKARVGLTIFLVVLSLILITVGILGFRLYKQAKGMYEDAKTAKQELSGLLDDIKSESFDVAQGKVEHIHEIIKNVRATLEGPIWKYGYKVPKYGPDYVTGCRLLQIADEMMDKYVDVGFDLLRENPFSTIKIDNTFNVRALLNYLEFAESALPDVQDVVTEVSGMEISLDEEHLMSKYAGKIQSLIDLYHNAEVYVPLLKAVLANGEDRLYIIAAQNSAEIRACGGFPGAMGTMRIKDGYMSIGSFASVWDVLTNLIPDLDLITDQEFYLFYSMSFPRDAEYDPYFPTVAKVWSDSYTAQMGEHVDGVISMTPAIIQKILGCTAPITLDDGTMLDGTNATKYIQNEIYMKYLNSEELIYGMDEGNEISDALFSQVAQLAMGQVFSNISTESIPKFMDLVTSGIEERIIMMWMRDPEAENVIRQYGAAGEFNTDPENPELGVFFSNRNPSKLGWYLDLDINVGEPSVLDDGSLRYNVSVSMYNTMDWWTAEYAGYYIAGQPAGYLYSFLHLVAPKGGYISGYWIDNWYWMEEDWYMGNQMVSCRDFTIGPQERVTAYFDVTTAPGVTTPLSVIHTPTLQQYR